MEYHIYWLLKSSCFKLSEDGKYGGFFEPKSWWKDDIYWLLKSSCFELFGGGNTVFSWAKKLIERWYLPVTEKFLFQTFWLREIRSFLQPKSWWRDDIYLVFLSFLWYSRTWEIQFFVQCYRRQIKKLLSIRAGDTTAFRQFYNFLLKCESVISTQNWNVLDFPEILSMMKVSTTYQRQVE